ncbi:hypothetical protein AO070_15280 [Pseudomonas syringae pv. syringae PD2766]|nr:hypothetical protein AO070_15280 [Pseudomonas syringae pv. syringae PD2766]
MITEFQSGILQSERYHGLFHPFSIDLTDRQNATQSIVGERWCSEDIDLGRLIGQTLTVGST